MAKCVLCGKGLLAKDRKAGECERCHQRIGQDPPSLRYVAQDAQVALRRGDPVLTPTVQERDCLDCRRGDHKICDKYNRIFCECRISKHKVMVSSPKPKVKHDEPEEPEEEWEVF